MNCWRKIYVDDLIPVDNEGSILLPKLNSTTCNVQSTAFTETPITVSPHKVKKNKSKL